MAQQRAFSKQQLSELNNKPNLHLLIHGNVYGLHEFVNEHPGGDLVLLAEAGRDATQAWEDVHHSDEAKELMKDYLVGYCLEASSRPDIADKTALRGNSEALTSNLAKPFSLLLLFLFLALVLGLYWEGL